MNAHMLCASMDEGPHSCISKALMDLALGFFVPVLFTNEVPPLVEGIFLKVVQPFSPVT